MSFKTLFFSGDWALDTNEMFGTIVPLNETVEIKVGDHIIAATYEGLEEVAPNLGTVILRWQGLSILYSCPLLNDGKAVWLSFRPSWIKIDFEEIYRLRHQRVR